MATRLSHRAGRLVLAGALALIGSPLYAQTAGPSLPSPATFNPGSNKGTVNMSVQNGSRASLSFGTNTSFGTSVSTSSTTGMSAGATSILTPAPGGTIKSMIGDGSAAGKTTAQISNLRANGTGNAPFNGSTINTTEGLFSSGDAVLDGVKASIDLGLKDTDTAFKASALPNSLTGQELFCSQFGTASCKASSDGIPQVQATATGDASSNQVSNASSSAQVSSNTNVDIQSSSFTSTFVQSF